MKIIKRAVLVLIAFVGSTYGMADEQNNDYYHGTVSGYDFNEYHLQLIKGAIRALSKYMHLRTHVCMPAALLAAGMQACVCRCMCMYMYMYMLMFSGPKNS